MNLTPIEHAAYAVAMQSAIGFLTGNWWVGAAFAIAWFISREHAQRELQITRGVISVNELKPWQGFTGWSRDNLLDAALPFVACVGLALFNGSQGAG